jgi:GH24 family phage-related lysozyme (muramidase)/plastocyanin
MPNPTTTEEAPANNKAKTTAYLVCDGALCQCDAGAAPVKLKVDSHKKAYINDNKLLATVKDIKFELTTAPFATCKNIPSQNKTCQPKFEKWTKPYKDIEVEGNQVITDKSELMCMAYGGKVTITMHGQKQTVNAGQADNMDRAIAAQVNSLADLAPIAEENKKVSVLSITGALVDDPKYKPVTTQEKVIVKSAKESKTDVDPSDIHVRPGQEIKFTANIIGGGVEALVCWKLKGSGEPKHFLQHGPMYQTIFSEVGKYTIEGYGTNGDHNLDVDTRIVEKTSKNKTALVKEGRTESIDCMLDILVQENKLINIRHLKSDNIIDKMNDGKLEEAQLRIGVPATFEPVFLMPPIQKEIDELILVIFDESGTELQRTKGEPKLVFVPNNSAAKYIIKAYFDGAEAAFVSFPFASIFNSVNVIATSNFGGENEKIRPGTFVKFTVQNSKFMDNTVAPEIIETENTQIKWYENSEIPAGAGRSYSNTYVSEKKYTIVCRVTEGQPGWFSSDKNGKDDWHFEVTKNYPTAIEKKSTGISKIGKQISFELKGFFKIDYTDNNTIHWKLTGPETKEVTASSIFEYTPKTKGNYILTASMNGRPAKDFPFECIACEIIKGWWTDSDGNMLTGKDDEDAPSNTIGFAGWEQEVVAAFKHVGLNNEGVTLEVWQKNSVYADVSLLKKEVTIPDTGNGATYSIKLDKAIKDKIKGDHLFTNENGHLYFTVKAKNGLKVINDGMVLPQSDAYLNVDSTVRAKAYFADNNDTKRYSTAALDTPVYVQVKSTNLIGEELEIETCEVGYIYDNVIGSRTPFKVDKYGMASVKLNMEPYKSKLPNANDSIRTYTKIYNKNTGEEIDPSSGNYKLTLYKTLKTSAASIGTTKAFVLVDASEVSTGSCGGKYCIKTGDVSELVREINIRLAGFGGLVPTDQFTAETRKGVIQFQRDYMKIEPTGQVCGNTLKAIDEFAEKYKFSFNELKCKCSNKGNEVINVISKIKEVNNCTGFGDGSNEGVYLNNTTSEKFNRYEHPGIHRSVLWGLKASIFYLSKTECVYKFKAISSGYRCRNHDEFHKKQTTNHMGKAIDIHYNNAEGDRANKVTDMNSIRKDIFEKYLDAKYWKANKFGLESAEVGATSWVHFDVREFNEKYLEDKYFVKEESELLGEKISLLANKIVLNCSGSDCLKCNTSNNKGQTERVDPKTLSISDKGIKFIKEWEDFKANVYNDSEDYCSIGYGHLIEKRRCELILIPDEFKNGITEEEAMVLFTKRLKTFENSIRRDVLVLLFQYEYDALVSLVFNSGTNFLNTGGLNKGETLIKKKLNKQDYSGAIDEFLNVTNGGEAGLIKRRKAEYNIFLKNIYDSKH